MIMSNYFNRLREYFGVTSQLINLKIFENEDSYHEILIINWADLLYTQMFKHTHVCDHTSGGSWNFILMVLH